MALGLAAALMTAAASAANDEPPLASQPSDQLQLTLATVRRDADGKLTMTLSDGSVWRQTERVMLGSMPAAGERLVIRRISPRSFLCEYRKGLAFSCARLG